MILLTLPVVFAVANALLYRNLRRQLNRRRLWRRTFQIGITVGVVRAVLASFGWYVVEHDGGPLQIPAFALAMLAWPEAAIISTRRVTAAPSEFYLALSFLLVGSTWGLSAWSLYSREWPAPNHERLLEPAGRVPGNLRSATDQLLRCFRLMPTCITCESTPARAARII